MPARHDARLARKVQEKAVTDKRQMAIDRTASAAPPPEPPASGAPPTRLITLEHNEHRDSTLYRFEKGYRVQFCPGPSLLGRKVFLYTNYVTSADDHDKEEAEFVRNQYYGLEWRARGPPGEPGETRDPGETLGAGVLVTDTDLYCELTLRRAGSFHYYFCYDNPEAPVGPAGSGWWAVAPTLAAGLPLDGLMCQTVLAKCLGPLPRWESVLHVAADAGYNMVHFTPLQELGASNSSYSIANQLRLNPLFGADLTFADVESLVSKMRTEWKVLSISDVVLNHTANESPWLEAHPEATYNCVNCPHLRPAALLDALLARLTADVARGDLESRGVPPCVTHHDHLEAIRQLLVTQLVPEARLHECYTCNVPELVHEFYCLARNKVPAVQPLVEEREELTLVPDPQYRRLRASVHMERALRLYNTYRDDCHDEETRLNKCCEELKRKLEQLNEAAADLMRDHLRAAVDNVLAGMRYQRLQTDGPCWREVSAVRPLAPRYFTWACDVERASLHEVEAALYGAEGARCAAHNGWVMDGDPLLDFAAAAAGARVYLRRELIAWGDSVKLRYGDKPEDSPFLWAHMREYVEFTAEIFDGLRLDNCHSTPLHVAEYMLDCARNVKPDLYVVAELFTNSDLVDNIFVNRLGITSLVREAQSAWDAHEQGRLVYRYGGRAVGAFLRDEGGACEEARESVAHAMLLDMTHDNESAVVRRSARDLPACAALVAAAACATGSTRGYDDLVPHHVHVVDETRLYPAPGDLPTQPPLLAARRALNDLHLRLARDNYCEVFVDQLDEDVIAVTRQEPATRKSVIVVAFTSFGASEESRTPRPLRFEGTLEEIEMEVEVCGTAGGAPFVRHQTYINGLEQYEVVARRRVSLHESRAVAAARVEGAHTVLEFRALQPGAVVVVRAAPRPHHGVALAQLERALHAAGSDPWALGAALRDLDLIDLNALLYRCEAEEREGGAGGGCYDVPGWGALPYAGLAGAAELLERVARADDLAHPVCDNLRAGDWLPEYVWARCEREPRLVAVGAAVRDALRPLLDLPRYLVPAYCTAVVRALHAAAERTALARLGAAAHRGAFWRALALTSVQLTGAVRSAPLPCAGTSHAGSLSAGLPHFAVGYMRCWGRDTFISLRGMFLLTERYQDARLHILSFGACLRHGLIPNLLDGGRAPRYNCRDAVWWWLLAVRDYCEHAPPPLARAFLQEPVARRFPKDDCDGDAPPVDQPLHDVVQEALDKHFQGLVFRERGAGRAIDAHMADRGFDVQIGVDPDTGFVFGGNDHNCGTWMDKMGSSDKAGNRGRPATPRDGSAVELVALCHAVVTWLGAQHRAGRYPHPGVARRHRDGALTTWTWSQWADRIRRNFERHFWVPAEPSAQDARPDLVHRRAIYKDTHGASRAWADYQLRCNYVVAMAITPDLFEPRHAWAALDAVEEHLLGPLGVKTLDPADWAYRAHYDNGDDSHDPTVAHGFNYHQGPEWGWPLGYYVRARLAFGHAVGRHARAVAAGYRALGPSLRELRASPWRGLPELTGPGGAPCRDSCRTQAWSAASALEALHALEAARRARPLPAA